MIIINEEGNRVTIDPKKVVMVTPTETGYAILGQRVHEKTAGDVTEFINELPTGEDFISLTWVGDHKPFYVNAYMIKEIRKVDDSMAQKYLDAKADVHFHGSNNRLVVDEIDTIIALAHLVGVSLEDKVS